MRTFKFKDDEIAVILNALYSRNDDIGVAVNNVRNPILAASFKSELKELKSLIEIFEKEECN